MRVQIVLLSPVLPSYQLESLIKKFQSMTDVLFFCGSAHVNFDLKRVAAEKARAVFVLMP